MNRILRAFSLRHEKEDFDVVIENVEIGVAFSGTNLDPRFCDLYSVARPKRKLNCGRHRRDARIAFDGAYNGPRNGDGDQ